MKKYYLCEDYNQNELLDYLLNLNDSKLLVNCEILSLNSFLSKNNFSYDVNIFDLNNKIKHLKLKRFKNIIDDFDFLNKIIDFYHELIKYNVKIEQLNLDDELKNILKLLEDFNYQKLNLFLENYDFSNFTIINSNYDLFYQNIIDTMIKKGANILDFKNISSIKSYEALNKRVEIELLAQKIIKENINLKKSAIILCDKAYINILKITFNRYEIPLNFKFNYQKDYVSSQLIKLLNFYYLKDYHSYLKLINSNFLIETNTDINEYLNKHLSLNHNLLEEFKLLEKSKNLTNTIYPNLEKEANQVHLKYQKIIEAFKLSYFDYVVFCYEILYEIYGYDKCKQIKKFIENFKDFINIDNHKLIIKKLENQNSKDTQYTNALNVYTLKQQALFKENIFVLAANQKNYPNFKTLEGYFNEESLINTNYPEIKTRFRQHLNNLKWLQTKNTTFSYSISDYNGKNFEISTYLEEYEKIKLNLNKYQSFDFELIDNIDENISKKVFFKNGVFKTSVSALELFAACPFYFLLKYGFKLYEDKNIQLDASFYGVIVHSLMQQLVSKYPNDYYNQNLDIFKSIIEKEFTILKTLYPNITYFDTFIDLIAKHLHNVLKNMQSFKENTYFIPSEFEKEVNFKLNDEIEIKGIIDRIDYSKNYFRIIDYKTSKHSLNDAKLALALQLQLHVYSLIINMISNKQISGAYYFNLNQNKEKYHFLSYGKKDGFKTNDLESLYQDLITSSLLSGKTYEFQSVYNNLKEVNVSFKKDGSLKGGEVTFDFYQDKIMLILEKILEKIKKGEFPLKPIKEATHYNEYRSICHYKDRLTKGELYFTKDKEKNNDEA